MTFDGATYSPTLDKERLGSQLERVRELMRDRVWRTIVEIHAKCGGMETGISARLRDLRKEKFGGYEVEGKRVKGHRRVGGLWMYQVRPKKPAQGRLFP